MQKLLGVFEVFVDEKQELRNSERTNAKTKRIKKSIKALKRTKSSWYPRARMQVNSRSYIKSALRLNPGDDQPTEPESSFFVSGTCFAENIHAVLENHGLQSTRISGQEEIPAELLFSEIAGIKDLVEIIRSERFPCFIFTLGFAESEALDKSTSIVDVEQPTLSLGKFQSPEFISESLVEGVGKLRAINSNLRVFLTVSPVPLEGTASRYSVFEANSISKSIVRFATALACEKDPSITYFPSYEIVTQVAPSAGICAFGDDDGHPRHVNKELVSLICSLFLERRVRILNRVFPFGSNRDSL